MKRIINAFRYSFDGLCAAFKSEAAFRQDILIFVIGTIVAIFLPVGVLSTALMICSLLFILFAELVNTAIETVVDRIGTERNPLSKKAKDIGSALVLLSFINAVIIWVAILI